jgi:hypothetical protein
MTFIQHTTIAAEIAAKRDNHHTPLTMPPYLPTALTATNFGELGGLTLYQEAARIVRRPRHTTLTAHLPSSISHAWAAHTTSVIHWNAIEDSIHRKNHMKNRRRRQLSKARNHGTASERQLSEVQEQRNG